MDDEGKDGKGSRVRLWDSCMFQLFTKEASGHNPRGVAVQRVRQRIMHKYNYFKDNYEVDLCTGCGRCVSVCPVNLDIREVIKKVLEY
jgi:sulfhydrogenase subunit beta (sulfur reductase)